MLLRFAVFQDPDYVGWVARSLSYDFVGGSTTREGAMENLVQAVALEFNYATMESRRPFSGLPVTPKEFVNWAEKEFVPIDTPEYLNNILPEAWIIEGIGKKE